MQHPSAGGREVMIVFMGPTGTGKSMFINLLTKDDNIRVGHDLESQTIDVSTSLWHDDTSGLSVTLVDTPGFDDSRSDITDTDILQKIANFLQGNGGRSINGIIYLHRISDPRVGGAAKKNLRLFRELCGDEMLSNVRLVTTNWNNVSEKEGSARQAELANRVFKPLIDAGAQMYRHDKGLASAHSIMSTLIDQTPKTMKIQLELYAGSALGNTSAGAVIIEEMTALQRKHGEEMEDLMKEMQEAAFTNDEDLRAELVKDRQRLEQLMANAEEDKRKLAKPRAPQGSPPMLPPRKSPNELQKPLPKIPQGEHVQTWHSDHALASHAGPGTIYSQEEMDPDKVYAQRIADKVYETKDKIVNAYKFYMHGSYHTS
ncbi:hypothetical protein HYPSUDRAFT_40697 [Hypholoma sublateritium FD-334 SS-4]|uniref:G domain-containing protein n=1 Tax=Hypholoma sublateritium (strain FD-334 SS-4) TaxID=945553 RepID=A0A0D2NUX2_HYPSF|nr:hypothetical protein HYPSUDRAFT_40697 [Hypholoma sublateritium FD-334 SS-4]